jgi:hypothetical protein
MTNQIDKKLSLEKLTSGMFILIQLKSTGGDERCILSQMEC